MSRDLERLLDSLDQMRELALEVDGFLEGITADRFRRDRLTQRAVGMNLVLLGETVSEILKRFPDFAADHPDIAWRELLDLRHHIVAEFATIDPGALWTAATRTIPQLLSQLSMLRQIRAQGE
ncbi:Uncharacterized conserved protein, contains HEPN domain [Rhizobium sp. RU35A]|uniref:HepT-like ribonuclease domain-containing protein n=1 Tax=Rhizobium sp. RU35A TaxID=1907414 RepID=UPI000955B275|nr:HepT-like ribonuclease domain-containing protein [Rhizobium sp. RU35A]SIQ20064.1 Uncharacterized conserved protein, contains HEPN domain [Rhizobium sp. RU35A]